MTPKNSGPTLIIYDAASSGRASYVAFAILVSVIAVFLICNIALASASSAPDCPSSGMQPYPSSGVCTSPSNISSEPVPDVGLPQPFSRTETISKDKRPTKSTSVSKKIVVYFFWGNGCPHCEEERRFLEKLRRAQTLLEIKDYEVWYNENNARFMQTMLEAHGIKPSGVPVTFVHDRVFSGFTKQIGLSIQKEIEKCRVTPCADPGDILRKKDKAAGGRQVRPSPFSTLSTPTAQEEKNALRMEIPFLGNIDARTSSLSLLTLVIAGMDSFNPCAFFVLLTLLGLLVHAQSRKKMLLIGGTFVFFSGLIYFLFMAAWLNLFLVMGHVAAITMLAGVVSLLIAGINIKDFFLFKKGISLTIRDTAKPKLFDRMRKLLRSNSLVSIMAGTIVLAVAANFYELLCTAGFPMVFTRILTLNNLPTATYYLYLVFYNIIYVMPMFIIVLGFTYTLGKRQLSEWQGRVLKLVSGTMMLGLGLVLIINPAILNSVSMSLMIPMVAVVVSLVLAMVIKRQVRDKVHQ